MGRKSRDKMSRPGPLAQPPGDGRRSAGAPPNAGSQADRTAPVPGSAFEAQRDSGANARAASTPAARRTKRPQLSARAALWMLALVAATAAAYSSGLDTPFLLDDPINIAKNPRIQRPLDLGALLADPRAVVTASLRWNFLAGGFEVGGYHMLNIVAHAATGLLVFALALVTLRLDVFDGRYESNAEDLAGVVALIFLLHPMQTESVTYVIQRAEVFAAAGLVGALLALAAMRERVCARPMAALAVVCVFGAYSKPSFAVVPALMLVYDACVLSRANVGNVAGVDNVRKIAKRWPAYLLAAAAAVATFLLTKWSGSFEGSTAGFDIEGISATDYVSAQFGVLVHYLRVALWPNDLCFDCGYRGPWPVRATWLGDSVLLPAAILLSIAAGALASAKRRPLVPLAVFASAVVLLPTSVVPLADFYVEHRMYLPIAFVALALVPAVHDAAAALARRFEIRPRALRIALGSLAALVAVALTTTTIRRNELLANPIALMEDSLAHAPQNERVHYNLANAYKRDGRLEDAIPHYEAAIRLLPNVVRSYQNLGSLYAEQGKDEDALRVYLAGAAAKPEVAMAHRNVALTYLRLGRAEEALEAAERAVALDPRNANGRRLAGDALLALGRTAEAAESWRAGLAASPGDSMLTERLRRLERQ
ncbi:MAG: tetratricopeptide repeat protein [Candidatus Binatia bacterium]